MNKQKIGVTLLSTLLLISAVALGGLMLNWHNQGTVLTATQIVITTTDAQETLSIEPGQNINSTITINNTGSTDIPMRINTTIEPNDIGFTEVYTFNNTAVNEDQVFIMPAGLNLTLNVSIQTDIKLIPMMYQVNTTII